MLEAAGWAALAASTLVIGAWLGTVQKASPRRAGVVMGFGAGALIASVSFELTEGAFAVAGTGPLVAGLGIGALTFFLGDRKVDRMGGARRTSGSAAWEGNANALLLGAALDGIPESLIIGLSLIGGGSVEIAFLVSVAVSNVPEGFASAAQQHQGGVATRTILGRWLSIVALSALCGAIGFALFDELDPAWVAFTQAFAAGALLTMVMDSMAPEAFRDAGPVTGLVAVAGFWLAFWLGTL